MDLLLLEYYQAIPFQVVILEQHRVVGGQVPEWWFHKLWVLVARHDSWESICQGTTVGRVCPSFKGEPRNQWLQIDWLWQFFIPEKRNAVLGRLNLQYYQEVPFQVLIVEHHRVWGKVSEWWFVIFQSPRLMTCYQYRNLTNQSSGSLPRQSVLLDYQNLVLDHLVEIQMEATLYGIPLVRRNNLSQPVELQSMSIFQGRRKEPMITIRRRIWELKIKLWRLQQQRKIFSYCYHWWGQGVFYQAKVQNYFPRPCGVVDLHLMDSEKQKLSWQILHQQKQSKTKEKRRLLLKQENADINLTSACTRKY